MNYKLIIGILIAIIIILIIGLIIVVPNTQKQESKLVMESNASIYENESISFKLSNMENLPIANSSVVIVFKDQNGSIINKSVVTDKGGRGNLSTNGLNPGNYSVNIIFNGNDKYRNSSLITNLVINKIIEQKSSSTSSSTSSSSTSSSTSNHYYGPDVDSGGITREQAQAYGWSYTSDHGGHYIGPNDRWDENAGVYHD